VTQIEGGEAASFQAPNTLVIQHDGPGYYALDARGRVFNSKGELVDSAIRPGTRVHVYFSSNKGERTLDRVVID
jgi:hypothetical protein